jgi:hypothetical protein
LQLIFDLSSISLLICWYFAYDDIWF